MTQTDPQMFDALMSRRHSCRGFRADPLPRQTIERIVATAQKVPSWCNSQPWQLVITTPPETDRLRDALFPLSQSLRSEPDIDFPERYENVYADRRRTCGWALYKAVGVPKGDRAASARQMRENFRFFGAPHVALVTTPKALGAYGVLDCGAFVTAFMLAAEAHGVASIAQAALAMMAPKLRDHFQIAEDRDVLCAVSFGYTDPTHPANAFRTTRADADDVIDWR